MFKKVTPFIKTKGKDSVSVRLIMYDKHNEGTIFDQTKENNPNKIRELLETAKIKGLNYRISIRRKKENG